MKRKIGETFFGLAIIFGSILAAFIHIGDSLYLAIAGLAFLVGMGILYHAGRIDISKLKFSDPAVNITGEVLKKNNQTIKTWNNINDAKSKLEMVGVAADELKSQGSS